MDMAKQFADCLEKYQDPGKFLDVFFYKQLYSILAFLIGLAW